MCYGTYQGKRDIRLFNQYLTAEYTRIKFQRLYEVYIADSLKNTNDILAHVYTGNVMKQRYAEVAGYAKPKEETRTADEIIEDIGNRLDEIGAM